MSSALKRIKTYLSSTMGNNPLHVLILVHVHKNILDNINLADAANEFVDIHSYQMYKTLSYVMFYHSLNRFPQANYDCISTY